METLFDKICHHVAFTTFWTLVILLVVILTLRFNQWENQNINACIEKGNSYNQCIVAL